MALSPQWLDQLRARITLSALVGRTVKLQRAGREYRACCPFHDEKTPSFYVNDAKGFYHCFGCQAHGDAIRWLTDQQGLPFMDAVKELAAQAGMDVPAPDPREARRAEQRATLGDVMTAAQNWFRNNLLAPHGEAARQYLDRRGIDPRTAEEFGFGLALDSRGALGEALSDVPAEMLVEGGLRIAVDGRDPYDRFRGRLMLPIQDARARVIAFGGRILDTDASDAPKYLNSPETPLFDKGSTLYNLHRAAPASRKTERVVVVEGYLDVVALAAAGIHDAVAPLGTALTERQIERLWRLVDRPVLCFDGDAAGRRAAMRAATRALPLLQPGRTLGFVTLPAGKDPDDMVREGGAAALERLLAEPQSLLDLIWEHERAAGPLATPEDKAGLKQRLVEHSEAIQQPDIRALYRREWLDRFSAFAFPPREKRQRTPFVKGQPKGRFPDRGAAPMDQASIRKLGARITGARQHLAQAVIAGLLRHPDNLPRHVEMLARYRAPDRETQSAIEAVIEASESLEIGDDRAIKELESLARTPDNAPFSFLGKETDPQIVAEDLAEAVALLVVGPQLDAAMDAATARFASDPEGAFAEQQRVHEARGAANERLKALARRRAAGPDKDTKGPGDVDVVSAAEQELD